MTPMTRELKWLPFFTLFQREIARFMKVLVQTVITPIVSSALYLMIFGVSLGKQIVLDGQTTYLAFLIPGLVMMGCLNNAFQNSSSTIITAKFAGDLEDWKASPLSYTQIVWAIMLAALARGLMVGVITLFVGEASHYGVYGTLLPIEHPLTLVLFLTLGAFCFACLGVAVAFWARTFDQMSAFGGFVLLPLIYLGGVFYSVDHLPGFWRQISMFNPLLYMINGVRYGVLGHADVTVELSLAVSVLAFALMFLLAMRTVRKGSFQRW
jgi:ABC-2 type transport system permease protein